MSGFTLQQPAPPRVLAAGNEPTCGQKAGPGVYCERPWGHPGGHLSGSHGQYWQAEVPQS